MLRCALAILDASKTVVHTDYTLEPARESFKDLIHTPEEEPNRCHVKMVSDGRNQPAKRAKNRPGAAEPGILRPDIHTCAMTHTGKPINFLIPNTSSLLNSQSQSSTPEKVITKLKCLLRIKNTVNKPYSSFHSKLTNLVFLFSIFFFKIFLSFFLGGGVEWGGWEGQGSH